METYNNILSTRFVALFILGLCLFSCDTDEPLPVGTTFELRSLGLSGISVHDLRLSGNSLFAATDDGIYHSDITTQQPMDLVGLKGRNILTLAFLSDTAMLASFRDSDNGIGTEEPKIFHSSDGGMNWDELENNFGGQSQEPIFHFEWDEALPGVLLATGLQVIAKSLDAGVTWEPIWGEYNLLANGMSAFINPSKPTDLWSGGQGGIENGFLIHLRDEQLIDRWNDLVPNPTTVKKIVFDNQNPQAIYVGWEGELSRTLDEGSSWKTLIDRHEESHFFFGVGVSEANPDLVFAGKWIKTDEPQSLELYYSNDRGETWETEAFPDVTFGGIQDMVVKTEGNTERIFVGLDKGGVYEIVMNR